LAILIVVDDELRALGQTALRLGVDSVRTGRGFEAFAIHQREGGEGGAEAHAEPELRWFVDVSLEAAVARARHVTATSACRRYAIGLHEEIRDREGVKRAAVVVEVGDREHDTALRMAQPYRPFLGPGQALETLGNPMMLGDTTNVLRGATVDPGREAAFVVVCPSCKKKNRVSLARARTQLPKCGACHQGLLES
jgi:hypothetical protein